MAISPGHDGADVGALTDGGQGPNTQPTVSLAEPEQRMGVEQQTLVSRGQW